MFGNIREMLGGNSQEAAKAWQMQAQRLARMGFHTELGKTVQKYYAEMPEFRPQPAEFKGRFRIPLLVDPRVSLSRQLQLYRIPTETHVTESELARLSLKEARKPYVQSTPYQIWVRAGGANRSLDELASDERGLTLIEGLAFLREKPKLFRFKSHGTVGQLDVIPIDSDSASNLKHVDVVSMEETICGDSFWEESFVATIYRRRYAADPKAELWVGKRYFKTNSRSESDLIPTVGKQAA